MEQQSKHTRTTTAEAKGATNKNHNTKNKTRTTMNNYLKTKNTHTHIQTNKLTKAALSQQIIIINGSKTAFVKQQA